MKATKGPWLISSSTMIVSPNLKIVGNCTPLGLGADVDLPFEVCRANAQLMASAPELLEALEMMDEALEHGSIDKRSQPLGSRQTYRTIIRAAIAAAKGKA